MTRSTEDRLRDILDAIASARLADDQLQLAASRQDEDVVQVAFHAILHNLFVIGEAVKSIPPDVLDREPETPWSEIAAMRDVIGHHYHRIVPAIIHRTVQSDLAPLEKAIHRLVALD